ncbi:transposase family protein, partial [Acinetobacter sp. AR2-3]|uniref:transposase family protein n=1 Tax=Acinetobacter sp. AR2-3 TaxID=1891969 RepID=UPI001160B97B
YEILIGLVGSEMCIRNREKNYNKMIGKIRVVIEHINSQLKRFRILSERYRNRRKRFGLRINLIAALVNRMNLQ